MSKPLISDEEIIAGIRPTVQDVLPADIARVRRLLALHRNRIAEKMRAYGASDIARLIEESD